MFRILTLNLNYYHEQYGEWDQRKRRIVELIRRADADILAFQAVRTDQTRYGGTNQAAQLSVEVPEYKYALYQPAVLYENGAADGNAFLARVPIKDTGYKPLTFLSGLDDPNRRVVLYACFDLNGVELHLFNAHTSWVERQAELNLKELLEYTGGYTGFRVLVGDFNQTPDSAAAASLVKQGWVDGWQQCRPSEPGYTFDSRDPRLRIDYVWVDGQHASRLSDIQVLKGNDDGENAFLSDHFALLAAFDLD